jgi:hypothetical protein
LAHAIEFGAVFKLARELIEIQSELARVPDQIAAGQSVLILEQDVVVIPERALIARGIGRLGRGFRVRMDLGEREIAKDEAQVVAQPPL